MKRSTPLLSLITTVICLPLFAQVNLEVASNGEMYISPEAYVFVSNNGNVNINAAGALIMDSVFDNYSDLYVDGASTGNAEYRHHTGTTTQTDLVSPPVSGQTFASFATNNAGKIPAGTITPANLKYGPLDKATGAYVEYAATDPTTLVAGQGYRAGSVPVSGASQTLSYNGAITTEDVPVQIVYSAGIPYKESNLIGNPFTTHVISGAMVAPMVGNAAINQSYAAIYGWQGTAGRDPSTWDIYNSTTDERLLTPGQGFIVVASTAGGTLTFPESARVVSDLATNDNILVGRSSNSTPSSFKLKLTKESEVSTTKLYFIDSNGTRGLDVTYDAGSLGSSIGTHLVEGSEGINFAIQVLSKEDLTATDYAIPLEVIVDAGQEATISIENLNVPLGTKFYLHDTELNTQTLLTSHSYTFTPTAKLEGIGRFYLRTTSSTFSNASTALNAVEILSLASSKQLVVRGQLVNDSVLKLYDIRGRAIDSYELDASQTNHLIDVSSISSGIYIVNLNNKNQSKTTKLVIN